MGGNSETTSAESETTSAEWERVQSLIRRGSQCPACTRLMADWPGCESPDCPVPLDRQSEFFASF
jgi:hypothetical protein